MEQEYTSERQYDNDGGYYEGEYYYDAKGNRYDQFGGVVDPSGRYYPPVTDAMSEATGIFDDDDEEDYNASHSIMGNQSVSLASPHSPTSYIPVDTQKKSSAENEEPNIHDVSMSEEVPETEPPSSPLIQSMPLETEQSIPSLPQESTPALPQQSIPSIPQSTPIQESSLSAPIQPSEVPKPNEVSKDSNTQSVSIKSVPPPPPSLLKFIEEHPDHNVLRSKIQSIINTSSETALKSPIRVPLPMPSGVGSKELNQLSKKYNIDEDLRSTMTQSIAKYTEEELAVEINNATKQATEEAQTIIAGLGGTIKRLQQEVQSYIDKNAELERTNTEMREVIDEVYEQLNVIKEEGAIEASKHYQEQIEKIEQSYKQQITDLNTLINERNMNIESLKNDITELNANQTRLVNELKNKTNECESLRQQYEECASLRLSDQNTFNNTLKDKTKSLEEYIDKYNQVKQALEEERQKISEHIKEIHLFTFNQEREKQKYNEICKQYEELEKKYEDIKSQYNTISVSESSLKDQYTYVYNSYENLRQQFLTLQKENNELKISLEGQAAVHNSQQVQEINKLKALNTQYEQEITRLKIILFDLQDPHHTTSIQVEDGKSVDPHQFIKELSDKNNDLQKNLLDQIHQNEDLVNWVSQILESLGNSQ